MRPPPEFTKAAMAAAFAASTEASDASRLFGSSSFSPAIQIIAGFTFPAARSSKDCCMAAAPS